MQAALGLLTALAILSFLYFFFAAMAALGQARAEKKRVPYPKLSLLPAVFDSNAYTDRGKEWMATYYRRWFFGFASGAVMVVSGAGYVHLRDGAVGSPFNSPVFIAAPAVVFVTALTAFLACALWLLVCLAGAALRKLRSELMSDAQRRQIVKILQWTAGCFVIAAVSLVIMRHQ